MQRTVRPFRADECPTCGGARKRGQIVCDLCHRLKNDPTNWQGKLTHAEKRRKWLLSGAPTVQLTEEQVAKIEARALRARLERGLHKRY